MFTTVVSCVLEGLKGSLCEVECAIAPGFPCFHVLGLSASAAGEAHEKLLAALKASGFALPAERITLNVRPPRFGRTSALELAMAVGLLCAKQLVPAHWFNDSVFAGELSLDGSLLPLDSAYCYAMWAKKAGYKRIFLPVESLSDIGEIADLELIGVRSLPEIVEILRGKTPLCRLHNEPPSSNTGLVLTGLPEISFPSPKDAPDLSQIVGQEDAKRALIIACAGFHNLLLIGPPGIGKSLLASSAGALLPIVDFSEQRELKSIYSIAHLPLIGDSRPFRTPHHTTTPIALLGGGSPLKPGEISLAHHGILFLDEVAEFPRAVLEALRLPLEEHTITLDRLKEHAEFPADFMLIAGMNPCPCGYAPDESRCTCSATQIQSYQRKVSGPLADRIDLVCRMEAPLSNFNGSYNIGKALTTADAQTQIKNALEISFARQGKVFNSHIAPTDFEKFCPMTDEAQIEANRAFQNFQLSMRGYHRLIRVARTIADLAGHEVIELNDVDEAMGYHFKNTFT